MEKAPEKTPPDLNLGLSSNGRDSYSRSDSNFGTGRYYFENLLHQCGELPLSSTTVQLHSNEVKSSSRRCESACTHTHKHHLLSLTHTNIYTHMHIVYTHSAYIYS